MRSSGLSGVCEAFPSTVWAAGAHPGPGRRMLAAETAVAIVHDGLTSAVTMASPDDLEDFGVGYSLTQGFVASREEIRSIDVFDTPLGIELRIALHKWSGEALAARRRHMAGPGGSGLGGLDSLSAAARRAPNVEDDLVLRRHDVREAIEDLSAHRWMRRATGSGYAAGYWSPALGLIAAREDLGRHNALDKLIGARARGGPPSPGAVIITGAACVEAVQRVAAIGAGILIGHGAPTGLAVRTASDAGVTLVAADETGGFELFSHPGRVIG
jgi:FdhD protein